MSTNVVMPKLGESVVEGTVAKWLKQEGETIKEMEALLEVNTDKVDTEIPSPAGGTLLKILVPEGTTVNAGVVLAVIGNPGESAELTRPTLTQAAAPVPKAAAASRPMPARRELGFISPVVTKLAGEHNLDLSLVTGTGEGGRITKKDVLAYLDNQPAATAAGPTAAAWETPGAGELFRPPELQFAGGAPGVTAPVKPPSPPQPVPIPYPSASRGTERPGGLPGDTLRPFSPARLTIARRMAASKQTIPHATTVMEADLHFVVAHREANRTAFERDGVHLTYSAYFAAACVAALKVFPDVNSSWSDAGLMLHRVINIGIAVSLGEEGLIVPVIRDADGLSLLGIARAINDLAERSRIHRLRPDEAIGSTFTITNHGVSGSLFATPIINQPNCAILGVGAIQKRPVIIDDAIAIRPMAYLGLTFDHRILDGAVADGFLAKVVEVLEYWI
jgi:pyruvate/2-oxoglutarate dehydrogenase complex dihydrolipoamide acyltransferase (E2) component